MEMKFREGLCRLSWPFDAERLNPRAQCCGLHTKQLRRAGFAGDTPASGLERGQQIAALKLFQFLGSAHPLGRVFQKLPSFFRFPGERDRD